MGKKSGLCAAVALVVVTVVPATVARAAIMVDDFTDKISGTWPIAASTPYAFVTTPTEYGLADTLGGERLGIIYIPGPASLTVPGFDAVRADVYNDAGHSFLDVDSTAGGSGGVSLAYGDTDNRLGLTYAPGVDAIRIVFLGYDSPAGQPLKVTVNLSYVGGPAGPTSVYAYSIGPSEVTAPGDQVLDIPLTSYWNWVAGGTLDVLTIGFAGGKGSDFRIDSISLVPEPASAAGLAVAAGAIAVRRRRA